MKKKLKPNSVQSLLGMLEFSEYGLLTTNGEVVIYKATPTNISVLAPEQIEYRLSELSQIMNMQSQIEICCCDAEENFTANKLYLSDRASEEEEPTIKALLEEDKRFLDELQVSYRQSDMASCRQFLFILRLKKTDNRYVVNQFEKQLNEHGFFASRMEKDDLKRLIARYFGYYTEIPLPDYDGM